jgi:hypothetical protein
MLVAENLSAMDLKQKKNYDVMEEVSKATGESPLTWLGTATRDV